MTATAPLTIHNATIHTATVEIKTLTLSGKQITLSVFRQIPEEQIIEGHVDGYSLAGNPWGQVNYCPGKGHCELANGLWKPCGSCVPYKMSEWVSRGAAEISHAHVIWEKGGILRRCAVLGGDWRQWEEIYSSRHFYEHVFWALADLPQLFIAV